MIPFSFSQKAFIEEVFEFLENNKITMRAFYRATHCSPATLYRAKKSGRKITLRIETIQKIQNYMDKFWKDMLA